MLLIIVTLFEDSPLAILAGPSGGTVRVIWVFYDNLKMTGEGLNHVCNHITPPDDKKTEEGLPLFGFSAFAKLAQYTDTEF